MSLQWSLIALFLYIEIAITILLILPIISAPRWQRFFKSKFLQSLGAQAHFYFYGFLVVLILFFIDSIREMQRYSGDREHDSEHGHLDYALQHSMKLFRAQRNFYISGFTLFLYLVIRRLVLLISRNATLIADKKASISQAQNASKLVETLMAESSHKAEPSQKKKNEAGDEPSAPNVPEEELQQQLTKLRIELSESKEVAARYKRDLNAVKDQAKSVTAEYDRLLNEFGALELKYDKVMKQASGDKKKD